jgi:hypothetical protein
MGRREVYVAILKQLKEINLSMTRDKSRLPFEVTRDRDEKPEPEGGKKESKYL